MIGQIKLVASAKLSLFSAGEDLSPIQSGATYSSSERSAGTFQIIDSSPFVYMAAHGEHVGSTTSFASAGINDSPNFGDASLHLFDSWINTLAPWAQSGTATFARHGSGFDNSLLAADSDDHMTRCGWK